MKERTNNKLKASAKRLLNGSFSVLLVLTLIAPAWGVVFTNSTPITINDPRGSQGTATPYPSNITVSGMSGNITNLKVRLENFNHTFPDDVDILLVAPDGNNIVLMSDAGGGDDVLFGNITFDDAAATSLPDETQIGSTSYQPTNIGTTDIFPGPAPPPTFANRTLAAAFNGILPNGDWRLYVVDDTAQPVFNINNVGTFGNGWSMTITTSGSPATIFGNYSPIIINDYFGRATPYPSPIIVSGLTGAITDINVTLTGMNHQFSKDIGMLLVSPTGKNLILMSGAIGTDTTPLINTTITLDDSAAELLPTSFGVTSGRSYRPAAYWAVNFPTRFQTGSYPTPRGTGTLGSVFNGTDPNGAWSLYVIDTFSGDSGTMTGGWSIDITANGSYGAKRFTNSDFDGDGRSDTAVYRPSDSFWYLRDSTALNNRYAQFGATSDLLIPGDYDGDRRHDLAVFRPDTGHWFVLQSATGTLQTVQFGAGTDKLVPADYDGDGQTDIAVWRPSNGAWYIRQSNGGSPTFRTVIWGASTDVPVRGHFEGTNGADFTVFRPSENRWYILNNTASSSRVANFGASGDQLTPGDYDGDGKTDVAVWRPSTGAWYVLRSSTNNAFGVTWGQSGDIPVPGDYDGDSRTDITVWRPSTGNWTILNSGASNVTPIFRLDNWGAPADTPLPDTYLPE